MPRRQKYKKWGSQCLLILIPLLIVITLMLQRYNNSLNEFLNIFRESSDMQMKQSDGPCKVKLSCPEDQFSFFIQSGAANVVPPKVCLQNELVLGSALNNAGFGINIVLINGKTAEVTKTNHFDMYSGEVKPLIEFLQSIEDGSVVLMVSYDEPSSKLTEEARKLISELGSSVVHSLSFRDNWVFVGGKGAVMKSNFEKHIKNDHNNNKYENWPELIDLQGCIPKYLE
ncbi:protein FAM3C isoform X2 [Antennarius striatus]|uniref:protein FAM3C isoform X2 n=1 Tax=Antennarius striatus TaxID=241820 RepID=UPI0035B3E611